MSPAREREANSSTITHTQPIIFDVNYNTLSRTRIMTDPDMQRVSQHATQTFPRILDSVTPSTLNSPTCEDILKGATVGQRANSLYHLL